MVDISEFFANMPLFTRSFVILAMVFGMLTAARLVKITTFYLEAPYGLWNPMWLLSYAYIGNFALPMLFEIYFFAITAGRLELEYRPSRYPDFFIVILFNAVGCLLIELLMNWGGWVLLSTSFVMSLTYIFCKRNPNEQIMLFFIFTCKTAYLPFALLVIEFFQSQGAIPWSSIIGIAVGHLFIYLKDILPVSHRKDYLGTPRWAVWFVNKVRNSSLPVVGNGGIAQGFGWNQEGRRIFGGRGVRIG